MSDEEDYMSDAFLAKLQDVTPSLVKNSAVRRKNEIESRQIKEKERRKPIFEQQKDKLKEGSSFYLINCFLKTLVDLKIFKFKIPLKFIFY